jgi:hypothetical protein
VFAVRRAGCLAGMWEKDRNPSGRHAPPRDISRYCAQMPWPLTSYLSFCQVAVFNFTMRASWSVARQPRKRLC